MTASLQPCSLRLQTLKRCNGPLGLWVPSDHHAFVAGAYQPVLPGQTFAVSEGDVIALVPKGHLPIWRPDIRSALRQPFLASPRPMPTSGVARNVLLLHATGKFIFGDFHHSSWENLKRATAFIGVPLADLCLRRAYSHTFTTVSQFVELLPFSKRQLGKIRMESPCQLFSLSMAACRL